MSSLATESHPILPRPPHWFQDVKTWIGVAAVIFSLGGAYTVFQDTRHAHEQIAEDTSRVLNEHKEITAALVNHTKSSSDTTQSLLQEIVKISRVNCINNAKDTQSRQACLQ